MPTLFVQVVYVTGGIEGSVWGVSVQGVNVREYICPWGKCPGGTIMSVVGGGD